MKKLRFSEFKTFSPGQARIWTQARADQQPWFPEVFLVLAVEVLLPRKPLSPGQARVGGCPCELLALPESLRYIHLGLFV